MRSSLRSLRRGSANRSAQAAWAACAAGLASQLAGLHRSFSGSLFLLLYFLCDPSMTILTPWPPWVQKSPDLAGPGSRQAAQPSAIALVVGFAGLVADVAAGRGTAERAQRAAARGAADRAARHCASNGTYLLGSGLAGAAADAECCCQYKGRQNEPSHVISTGSNGFLRARAMPLHGSGSRAIRCKVRTGPE